MPDTDKAQNLADALFSQSQQLVLGLFYGQPDKSFYTNEVLRQSVIGRGTIQRELKKLAQVGILNADRRGNQLHYQANPNCPIFTELCGIARNTFGISDVISAALLPVSKQIDLAFIYGSIAKGEDTASSDIDLLVVTESLAYADLMSVLASAEQSLGRSINPSIYTVGQIKNKLEQKNAFLTRVVEQPKIWVKGVDDDIRELRQSRKN